MSQRHPVFQGSITALPTPFRNTPRGDGPRRLDGAEAIDFDALRKLIERQIAAGTDALVVSGSTGESSMLSPRERGSLFEFVAGVVRGRVPTIAGVGALDTHEVCALAAAAERAGVDGLLVTTPAYSRPTRAGLCAHFRAVAGATQLPVSLYNIPSRTCVDLQPETVLEIARACPNVVAIKEASDSLDRLRVLIAESELLVLCGEDRWIADSMELGAAGVIGVVSNLVPERVARLVHLFDEEGDHDQAPGIVESLAPLVAAIALETNPAPLKAALALMGLIEERLRLPLVRVTDATRERVRDVLAANGLLLEG